MVLRLPRLPAGWRDQPQLFERYWDQALNQIEKGVNDISQVLVDLNIAQETAEGGLSLAQSAINPDGTIKANKVVTQSIASNSVTKPYFTRLTSDVPLPDTVTTVVCSIAVTKDVLESYMEIESVIRLESSDDLRGSFTLVRDSTTLDTLPISNSSTGGTNRLAFPLSFRDFSVVAGSHIYQVRFTRQGGLSAVKANIGSNLAVTEVKR